MTIRDTILGGIAALLRAGRLCPPWPTTLRYANQGDLKSLDPYTLNETTTNAHLGPRLRGPDTAGQGSGDRAGPGRKVGRSATTG